MQDFLSLWSGMLSSFSAFLMTEPVIYFVGAALLLFTIGIVKRALSI